MKRLRCNRPTIILMNLFFVPVLLGNTLVKGDQIGPQYKKTFLPGVLSLLLGPRTVADVIKDVDLMDYATETEIETDPSGHKIALTKMLIVFKPNATPEQLKQLLSEYNATIVSSVSGTRSIVVRIPYPGNLDAYKSIVDQMETKTFVDFVWMGEIPNLSALPSNYYSDPPNTTELSYIDNHLAVRGAAAWNASKAIDDSYIPQVIVADSFGEGIPADNTINYTLPVDGFATGRWDGGHGYAVLGIIAGRHGQYYTTGLYPDKISLQVVDHPDELNVSNWFTFAEIMNKLLITITRTPGHIVINTSNGYACDGTGGDCIDIEKARMIASLWVEYVRHFDLESRVLHVTSAGNIELTGIRDARTNSPFASAALLDGLMDSFNQPTTNLTNTVVVENAVNTSSVTQPYSIKCQFKDSFIGGTLSGIGKDVRSFAKADGTAEIDLNTGSSYATPQVAGLATYIWGINHTLTPQQIKSLMISTSDSVPVVADPNECNDWTAPAPSIDAYEALLSLDVADTPTSSNSPVRFSILDVNDDGSFDQNDLQTMMNKFYDSSGAEPVLIEPTVPNYGRYDLNGDGWTGGSTTTEFDLDRSGSTQYGIPNITNNATQDIEGTTVSFNEAAAKDTDILCYYAYSALYTGDNTERQNLLEDICKSTDLNCTHEAFQGAYSKSCYDPSNETNIMYRHVFPPVNNSLDKISIEIRDAETSSLVKNVIWEKILNQEPALRCDIGKPTGWFVGLSFNIETGQDVYFLTDPYNIFFPKEYKDITRSYCWPDYSNLTRECGTYACPSIDSIRPALAFPGDCHQWWDHFDSEGIWQECMY